MNNLEKPTKGIIQESYHYAIDGEFCSGYKEHNVIVTEWWKTGDLKNKAKELKTFNNNYYRHTKLNGWREYYKDCKQFKEKRYTGTSLYFVPEIQADTSKEYNKVNLGDW